jgi:hypothetical protein
LLPWRRRSGDLLPQWVLDKSTPLADFSHLCLHPTPDSLSGELSLLVLALAANVSQPTIFRTCRFAWCICLVYRPRCLTPLPLATRPVCLLPSLKRNVLHRTYPSHVPSAIFGIRQHDSQGRCITDAVSRSTRSQTAHLPTPTDFWFSDPAQCRVLWGNHQQKGPDKVSRREPTDHSGIEVAQCCNAARSHPWTGEQQTLTGCSGEIESVGTLRHCAVPGPDRQPFCSCSRLPEDVGGEAKRTPPGPDPE